MILRTKGCCVTHHAGAGYELAKETAKEFGCERIGGGDWFK